MILSYRTLSWLHVRSLLSLTAYDKTGGTQAVQPLDGALDQSFPEPGELELALQAGPQIRPVS